ncbi:DNA polymerase III subunit epsilon [Teredinibacter sp. KSP-S5-2]|uniref:DNA polymerase III subunit epsilon n=1 Tax=Teredinibacter sp. KSP-S5-2 TaxID=3034506 RepID=UPI002934DA91|nr:DNA polymerase III subunit epsilon [Teredinibacter sp. KSP-S5-2]WNO11376.1 DNA polymerase III subunit epsilon [Teredinibacter sp. KSP-S5-2]
MRQIVLDTETTGLEPQQGHKIIEIGCVELVNRKLTGNHYHQYIQPNRDIDEAAIEVHGITQEFLADKPTFDAIVNDFLEFIDGAELIIHNAPFDVGFLNHELKQVNPALGTIEDRCKVLDSLVLARKKHPGQKNNLDALCKRYMVDNSQRDLHGALLDSEILADVYLAMTGGQTNLALSSSMSSGDNDDGEEVVIRIDSNRPRLKVIQATAEELEAHRKKLEVVDKASGGKCLWLHES